MSDMNWNTFYITSWGQLCLTGTFHQLSQINIYIDHVKTKSKMDHSFSGQEKRTILL